MQTDYKIWSVNGKYQNKYFPEKSHPKYVKETSPRLNQKSEML